MVICEDYNILFYHIPKNGGTSIKTILIDELGGKKLHAHISYKYADQHIDDPDSYISFAVVRNPYSRMLSWYFHLKKEGLEGKNKSNILAPDTFESFIKYQKEIYKNRSTLQFKLWDTQLSFICKENIIKLTHVLKYESLQDDFDRFCSNYFGDTFHLPRMRNTGVQDNWREYYTNELKEIVYSRLRDDFEVFNYDKN